LNVLSEEEALINTILCCGADICWLEKSYSADLVTTSRVPIPGNLQDFFWNRDEAITLNIAGS
jgi:hypothetical protein